MKGYDGVFLLEYLLGSGLRPHKIIYNGSKIQYMHIQNGLNIRLLDSLNFLPMPLSSLPTAFGLKELKKGSFPHFFNTAENQEYVGPIPDPKYYGIDQMSPENRHNFLQWHKEQATQNVQFDFQKEILEYCWSDVHILTQACLKFRQLLLDATEGTVCPFQNVTIASTCMHIYKSLFLPENYVLKIRDTSGQSKWVPATVKNGRWKILLDANWVELNTLTGYAVEAKKFMDSPIAQVPSGGYCNRDTYSKISIQWLEYLMHKSRKSQSPIQIQHALNGGEYAIPGTRYKVDGFCANTNTVYQMHGCLWHGCPTCFPDERKTSKAPRTSQSMNELYALTLENKRVIEEMGYKYVQIWEHEFHEKIEKDDNLKMFVKNLDVQSRLDPRDSFFGGRTNATKLRCEVTGEDKMKYVDFCSLYPYVNAYSRYPVGHPEIFTSEFRPLTDYFGIAKVTVLPPRGLYHPVLPYRSGGKLKFPLCATCADSEQLTPCLHTDKQRSLTGTWCTPELHMAMNKGYQIVKIFEVYHWDQTMKGELFGEYINTFLKLKQQASGWPSWCKTENDKRRYLANYKQHQGIELEPDKIQKNPGIRSLAKLC
ncbi:MAG: DNA polymerase, partial [Sedimenticola sp.]